MTDIQNGKMTDPGKQSWNIKAGVFSSCIAAYHCDDMHAQ